MVGVVRVHQLMGDRPLTKASEWLSKLSKLYSAAATARRDNTAYATVDCALWSGAVTSVVLSLCLSGCGQAPSMPESNEYGSMPTLVAPESEWLPTLNPAKAIGWRAGEMPTAAEGLEVNLYADNLDHPRWLLSLPNGDVLVAESQAPAKSGGFDGITGWIAKQVMRYAGAGGISADRITLLRDADNDGKAEQRFVLRDNLHSPFGMAHLGDYLYVANTDALLRFKFQLGDTTVKGAAEVVTTLPAGALNHHWTKNIIAANEGQRLYVAVGSNSNIGENGLTAEHNRAAILEVDLVSGNTRVYAKGLRNPVGLAYEPSTGQLWTVVNERDALGAQLVPDYLAAVHEHGDYGWPFFYWGNQPDPRVDSRDAPNAPVLTPDYALGAHTASLGLAFYHHEHIESLWGGALIGQHGSWNRRPASGYRVIFVPFEGGQPRGEPRVVLDGFLNAEGNARGRPAGVVVDPSGAILVADDAGNRIWRISAATE